MPFLMSHKTRTRRRSERPLLKKPGSGAADLCRPHWTRTIFLDACWQQALGMPLVMTFGMLMQLEAVPYRCAMPIWLEEWERQAGSE